MYQTSTTPVRPEFPYVLADPTAQRRSSLATEAKQLARRRAMALAVAGRCRKIAEAAIAPEAAQTVSSRALKRASTLHIRFHRTLDALVSAGGFDEALAIVRSRAASR